MHFLLFEYLIAGKQYAITLTAGDTELKGSQKIPLVELCFKFFLSWIVAYIFTGIQRYVVFCLICLIPFHFVCFPRPPFFLLSVLYILFIFKGRDLEFTFISGN